VRRTSRSPFERLAAWIACGPLGHLYAGAADWMELLARYAAARRRRDT
jgi:hypothetical protein